MAFMAPIAAFAAANAGTIGTVLGVAGAAVSGINAIQQGNYQAAVAKNNAMIAEDNAAATSLATQQEQMRSDRENAAILASSEALAASSGLDSNSASFVRGRMLTRRTGRMEAQDITARGAAESRSYLQDAANYRAEGSAAKKQGVLSAVGTGIGAASSAFGDIRSRSLLSKQRGGRPTLNSRPSWYGRG